MKALMVSLRENPPKKFGKAAVTTVGDYNTGLFTNLLTGEKTPTGLPKSDVLYYILDCGDIIVVRPSGTEPKVKFYFLTSGKDKSETDEKIALYKKTISDLI